MRIKQTFDHERISFLNEEVQKLHVSLYPDYFKEYDHIQVSEFYKSALRNSSYQFYCIEHDEQSVGYIWIEFKDYKENVFKKAYKSVYIHQISILEEYQSRGLGQKLLEFVEEIAENNQIKKVELDYWNDNTIAKEFYIKKGYTKYREFVYKDV